MKKAGKFISYLLVLAMVTSLISGLGIKPENADAKITAPNFTVLEIVPDKSMGTFGYLVDGYFGMGLNSASDAQTISNTFTGNQNLRNYLIGAGLAQNVTTSYTSTNYFEEHYLKSIQDTDWNVTVKTRTAADLNESDINSADLIVISETVPGNLKTSGVASKNFRTNGSKLSAAQVFAIFKKIAGADGQDPVPYIIDFDLYGLNTFVDVRTVNTIQKSKQDRFGFEPANQEHVLTQGGGDFQGLWNNSDQAPNLGTDATSFKLYKLLSCIDPSTLYGLYVACSDGSFGIDEELNLLELYTNTSNLPSAYNRGGKLTAWTDEYFAPNYLAAQDAVSGVKTKMGWFEASTGQNQDKGKVDPGTFAQTIGAGVGHGIVFNSNDGLFYAMGIKGNTSSSFPAILGAFASSTSTNDYHPYRYILKTSNTSSNNRSVIADMVKEANTKGYGLPNGIEIWCMSSAQYANLNVSSAEFDGVFTSSSDILNDFKSKVGHSVGVNFITLPTVYYTNFKPSFQNENGWASYLGDGNVKVDGNVNYINDDAHPNKKTLDFKLKLSGAASYNIVLYVDANGDLKFGSDEAFNLNGTITDGIFEKSVPLTTIFGEEAGEKYVGAFSWRLVINGHVVYDGVSAIRNVEKKNLIKILQVYPTNYDEKYGDSLGTGGPYVSNPTLLLPTKAEITSAGTISTLNPTTQYDTVKQIFSGKIKVDYVTSCTSNYDKHSAVNSKTVNIDSNKDNKRNHMIVDTSLFYYYLDMLKDYEIDVTRYSVVGFNQAVSQGKIVRNEVTNRLGLADGEQKKNLDGSLRYGYSATDLGLSSSTYQTYEVTWTEGKLKKYLVDETTGAIYGQREDQDGKVTYYGSTRNGATGVAVKGTTEENEFDILMIGFGSTMDYMDQKGVNLIKAYLENNGAAFIGNGAVTLSSNNTLGKAIAGIIGMSAPSGNWSAQSGYDYYANTAIPIMVTNDTVLAHYPYTVEKYMRASGASKQPLKLNISGSDAPVVAFVKYNSGNGDYNSWGDAEHNYYVYKKGNITFCGFGSTFPKAYVDQVGGVMTLAETLMIVNALVATSRFGSGGIVSEPFMNCIDPDRSVIGESMMEDDFEAYYFKDSIYTDYDAYGIAKFKDSADTVFNTPIDSAALKPEGFTDPTTNIRWIPYRAKLATEDGGYIVFQTTDNMTLPIQVYKYNESSKTFAKQTPVSGTTNKYSIPQKGIYYIGVPIDPSGYSGVGSSTKLGFRIDKNNGTNSIDQFAIKMLLKNGESSTAKTVETHTIIMVRRVLYHTS